MTDQTQLAIEQSVLGSLLLDNSQHANVDLHPDDFVSRHHAQIYDAIRRMISNREQADPVTVAEKLSDESHAANWLEMTCKLATETPYAKNAGSYAGLVKQRSRARQAIAVAGELSERITNSDPAAAIDEAIRKLMALNQVDRNWLCHQSEALTSAIELLDKCQQTGGKPSGISTGITDVDDRLGGMHPGDLVIVAARPAMGKTAWMLNGLIGADVPTGVISGEQGRDQIGMRLLAINGNVSLHNMRRGKVSDDEWGRISRTIQALKEKPVWFFDKPAPSIDDIWRLARMWRYEKGIKLLMVDYLQKIQGGGVDKRIEVGYVTEQLKNIGRELGITVVALAQVKREVENRPLGKDGLGRMPYMGDIAESGYAEREADQVYTLYRPYEYEPEERFKGLGYVNICKNRHGPTGFVKVAWRGEFLQFGDLAHQERIAA